MSLLNGRSQSLPPITSVVSDRLEKARVAKTRRPGSRFQIKELNGFSFPQSTSDDASLCTEEPFPIMSKPESLASTVPSHAQLFDYTMSSKVLLPTTGKRPWLARIMNDEELCSKVEDLMRYLFETVARENPQFSCLFMPRLAS